MSRRRSVLHRRIGAQPGHMAAHATAHLQTLRTPAPVPGGHPVPPMEMTMPLTLVEVTADGVTVREAQPLYAGPRGAPVPATGPGQWQQLYAAGRP
jgi:hypothetical protein